MKALEAVPAHMQEDWERIVMSPGMNVLATIMSSLRTDARRELEKPTLDTIALVEHRRGQIVAYTRMMNFIKSEFDRAARGESRSDTTAKKED